MKLISFRLTNYKSFADSQELRFDNGFNVIVGQNNSGKSALLQGVGLHFDDKPHLSLKTKPTDQAPVPGRSEAEFTVACEGDELRTTLINRRERFTVPIPNERSPDKKLFSKTLDDLFSARQLEFRLRRFGNGKVEAKGTPSFAAYATQQFFIAEVSSDRPEFVFSGSGSGRDNVNEIGALVGREFIEQLYFFRPERLLVAESGFGHSPVLRPDASNLPEVLGVLQSNIGRFNRFNEYVSQIFPTIRRVTVRPNTANKWQIAVWTIDPATEREDLAMSLADCGTGVGQVLAILYVAVTSPPPFSRTVIIDEPNSFLHPGAAKKLLEILRTFPHLQFVISTHSPEIVRAANANTLSIVRWADGASHIEQARLDKVESLELVLRDVGASLSDVFGADQILWVEGSTEEICFPLVISNLLRRSLIGIAVAAVRDTGRLTNQKPSADLVWQIYNKISTAGTLMPPAVAFFFDREGRSEAERSDIVRRSRGQVHFLPRRMYENYLLDSGALSALMSAKMGLDANAFVPHVENWLSQRSSEFLPTELRNAHVRSAEWLREIDGAALLHQLVSDLSDNQQTFDKTRDAYELTQWLVTNRHETLRELADHIERALGSAPLVGDSTRPG